MKHVGVRSNAKDIVSQEQLSNAADPTKLPLAGGNMTGAINQASPLTLTPNASNGNTIDLSFPFDAALNSDNYSIAPNSNGLFSGFLEGRPGMVRNLKFTGTMILPVSSARWNLPSASNIITANGDTAIVRCDVTGGSWDFLSYLKKDGTALVSGAGPANTDALPEGTTNLYFTAARVLSVALTGLSLVTGSAVVATDSILVGIGKLQKQITDLITTVSGKEASITAGTSSQYWNGLKVFTDFATSVRSAVLTGLSLASPAAVTASDTVLAAIGKLQAQITNNAFRVETIATTSVGQTSYAIPNGYTAGAVIVFFNGALLAPADYTATDGANVVLASGSLTTSDIMSVIVIAAIRAQDDALLQYTVAALPAASANLAKQRWCTNMAGGAGVVVSNGTNWLRVADNTIVTV